MKTILKYRKRPALVTLGPKLASIVTYRGREEIMMEFHQRNFFPSRRGKRVSVWNTPPPGKFNFSFGIIVSSWRGTTFKNDEQTSQRKNSVMSVCMRVSVRIFHSSLFSFTHLVLLWVKINYKNCFCKKIEKSQSEEHQNNLPHSLIINWMLSLAQVVWIFRIKLFDKMF